MYTIEKNVPILRPRSESTKEKHEVIERMEAGDSILLDNANEAMSFYQLMRRKKVPACRRRMTDGTFRVWRTK